MIIMLITWTGLSGPYLFGGGFNPAGSLPSMLLLPEKKFGDGVGYNHYWTVYICAPYISGVLSAFLFKVHCFIQERIQAPVLPPKPVLPVICCPVDFELGGITNFDFDLFTAPAGRNTTNPISQANEV